MHSWVPFLKAIGKSFSEGLSVGEEFSGVPFSNCGSSELSFPESA